MHREVTLVNKIAEWKPFSFLPGQAKEDIVSQFKTQTFKKDTILLTQEISSIEKFLFLSHD